MKDWHAPHAQMPISQQMYAVIVAKAVIGETSALSERLVSFAAFVAQREIMWLATALSKQHQILRNFKHFRSQYETNERHFHNHLEGSENILRNRYALSERSLGEYLGSPLQVMLMKMSVALTGDWVPKALHLVYH